ncbi:unnamed protein product [Parnassius apollo]|uniref:(apollo) hypothetical protein n=1 Tax=Parnassius apollo TaxID=110799 RepID=A0A8S3X566_PARAO|nr:unnamed protein product [Parnassius apollo]
MRDGRASTCASEAAGGGSTGARHAVQLSRARRCMRAGRIERVPARAKRRAVARRALGVQCSCLARGGACERDVGRAYLRGRGGGRRRAVQLYSVERCAHAGRTCEYLRERGGGRRIDGRAACSAAVSRAAMHASGTNRARTCAGEAAGGGSSCARRVVQLSHARRCVRAGRTEHVPARARRRAAARRARGVHCSCIAWSGARKRDGRASNCAGEAAGGGSTGARRAVQLYSVERCAQAGRTSE